MSLDVECRLILPGHYLMLKHLTVCLGLEIAMRNDGLRLCYGNRIVAHSVALCAKRLRFCRKHGTCFPVRS